MEFLMRIPLAALAALATVSLAPSVGLGHDAGEGSWMNHLSLLDPVTHQWCCNEQDCAPVPTGGVLERADGMLVVETGEVIARERIIWRAPDGRWWRCRNLGGENAGMTRCLIGPPRGM
jgi:hypothetical protein